MDILIQKPDDGEEEQIIIKCHNIDEQILAILSQLKNVNSKLIAYKDGSMFQIDFDNIYYFESVDNKVFVYLDSQVLEVNYKLYEIEERYKYKRFIRISKSIVVNLDKIESLSPAFNGRFEAMLKNGEKTIISRSYMSAFKEKLGL